jgi:two-component system OmpR family response regulator
MAKLLLIEDNKETADEIRAELGDRGFEVDWAANGIEGLDKARLGAAEAMIVDRLLPGMDGLTIIEALRHEGISHARPGLECASRRRRSGARTARGRRRLSN